MEENITDTESERKRTGNGNLIPPVKGEIRNPNGRGKGVRNRSTIIREILEAAAADALKSKSGIDLGVQPQTIFDQLVHQQVIKAATGDTAAFKELADGAFGKLTDKVETKHSFTAMGKVMVIDDDGKSEELVFNVGEAVTTPEDLNEEGENEDE